MLLTRFACLIHISFQPPNLKTKERQLSGPKQQIWNQDVGQNEAGSDACDGKGISEVLISDKKLSSSLGRKLSELLMASMVGTEL